MRRLAVFTSVAVLVGFLLPVAVFWRSEFKLLWPWQFFSKTSGGVLAALLVAPIASVVVLILMPRLRGVARATTLFGIGAGALLFSLRAAGGGGATVIFLLGGASGGRFVVALMLLSAAAVAAGNRLRVTHTSSPIPRYLAGGAGALFLFLCLLPVGREVSFLGLLFDDGMWGNQPLMIVVVLGAIAYGVLGALHFREFDDPSRYCRSVTLLGRIVLVATPLLVLFTFVFQSGGDFSLVALLIPVKNALLVYGMLAWVGIGLVGWVDHIIRRRAAEGPEIARESEPTAPGGGLRARLERLKAAFDEELLTAEEYEAKRAQIVESTEF